jgi:hypothetical protein
MNQISRPPSFVTLAMQHAERGEWAIARALLEYAEALPRDRHVARFLLWEVCQALGDPDAGVAYLGAAVAETSLTFRPAKAPQRRVLVVNTPGDFQANLPVALLLDEATTDLHTLWLHDPASLPTDLPDIDCVFIAIAQDCRHDAALEAADRLAARIGKPVINQGHRIAATGRDAAAALLRDVPGAIVPLQVLCARATLAHAIAFPAIIRPHTSHAGTGLARIANGQELRNYLADHPADEGFFVAPFIDYCSADGLWRKFRVVFVGGRPMPFHLAIHDDWAVWYYNAGMDRDAGKRAEEATFLTDITAVFSTTAMGALEEIAKRIGLDYFGLDCGLMPDGTLVVFEVETGMIVHDRPEGDAFAYRQAPARRILTAVTNMIDARIAG